MSDIMRPMPFGKMMVHILEENALHQTIFNVEKIFSSKTEKRISLVEGTLENPIGPAAGPHTQLAGNIVACYAAGGRFFELKTVQILYGEQLGIPRPCISARDEAYNVEWSSEYSADKAMEEYIKAWYALKLISVEMGLGDPNAFIFNMSVGYNLEGIKSERVDNFIEGLKNAGGSAIWKECEAWTLENLSKFSKITEDYVRGISPVVCNSVALSTMHGCPADEIEAISSYLIEEKKLNVYLKCNPTLLGPDFIRMTLDKMGYDYMIFDKAQFDVDISFEDAVPMLERLQKKAAALKLQFGVKLSNTFPVTITRGELPGEQMYMSGKALYPLTIAVAAKISKAFDGKLPISYSGGADKDNIEAIFKCGIWPITICTVLLRGKGLDQMASLASKLEEIPYQSEQRTDTEAIVALSAAALEDRNYYKTEKARKKYDEVPSFSEKRHEDILCKALCKSCVRVCPNRANEVVQVPGGSFIVHIDAACNECGNCVSGCVQPCYPFKDRITFFNNEEDFRNSENKGFCSVEGKWLIRFDNEEKQCETAELPQAMKGIVEAFSIQHPYYL